MQNFLIAEIIAHACFQQAKKPSSNHFQLLSFLTFSKKKMYYYKAHFFQIPRAVVIKAYSQWGRMS